MRNSGQCDRHNLELTVGATRIHCAFLVDDRAAAKEEHALSHGIRVPITSWYKKTHLKAKTLCGHSVLRHRRGGQIKHGTRRSEGGHLLRPPPPIAISDHLHCSHPKLQLSFVREIRNTNVVNPSRNYPDMKGLASGSQRRIGASLWG